MNCPRFAYNDVTKISKSDFKADAKKDFRSCESKGIGQLRYYACPEGLIKPEELPPKWGLIYVYPKNKAAKLIVGYGGSIKTGEEKQIVCQGVFVFVGNIPNSKFLNKLIKLDQKGYILTDDNMMTSQEGIYACGDVRKKLLRQVVTACGEGATAAFAAQKYIEELKGVSYK